jgi:hypothetical protein
VAPFHPGIDVIAAINLPFVDVRRMTKRLQLLGNQKCPIAISARITDKNIGHVTVVAVVPPLGDNYGRR